MKKKTSSSDPASTRFHFHRPNTTMAISTPSISIAPVTAIP